VRVAKSHLRIGTFWYFAARRDVEAQRLLADHAIARHDPEAARAERPALALLDGVIARQARLVARWMGLGFIHGVMNTDNMTISGETIDYGPCAFMEAYDPATVFSSIDVGGRYAYGNQPRIAHWNLARLGEALLPLFAAELEPAVEAANGVLATFAARYEEHWLHGMRDKLGLTGADAGDAELAADLLAILEAQHVDMTSAFRALSAVVRGDNGPVHNLLSDRAPFDAWAVRWHERLRRDGRAAGESAAAMDRTNPVYIPRNQLVEDALAAAAAGDLDPYHRLVEAVTDPFDARAGSEAYALPSAPDAGPFRTFCGT